MQLDGTGSHLPPPDSGPGARIAVLVSRFNTEITEELRRGCVEGLTDQGVAADDIDIYHVPGAWELPQAALRVAAKKRHDAIIALGCVIRGETAHFDYVAGEAARGLGEVARVLDIPLLFGVLTTDTVEQAQARAGRTEGNKGRELAVSALGMLDLYSELDG